MKKIPMQNAKCDFCSIGRFNVIAKYDAPTINGSWASMCQTCFNAYAAPNAKQVGFEFVKAVK